MSPTAGGPLEPVEVELPGGAEVAYSANTYAFVQQQIWVLEGRLMFREGNTEHRLNTGDCLYWSHWSSRMAAKMAARLLGLHSTILVGDREIRWQN